MSQEQEQIESTPEQDNADFLSGFNAVRPGDEQSPEPVVANDVEPNKPDGEQEEQADEEPGKQSEEPTFFGLSESQVKSLLERSAQVDDIKDQLRKAYGKIGELNSTVQKLSEQRQPTPAAAPAGEENAELSDWERDFPELAQVAESRARKIVQEAMGGLSTQQTETLSMEEIVRETNIAIMDATHDGWRETVSSQDFSLWIATQPESVQETFNTTVSAKVLGGILSEFDSWKAKTNDRTTRNKTRLEQALLPSGSSGKVTHAPSAHDEFVAGFNSVRAQH